MANETAPAADAISPVFDGAAKLVTFGPIGLAALMLVLVVLTLLLRNISSAQERILKLCLLAGFASLALLVGNQYINSSHIMYFRVEPHESDAYKDLPRPKVTVNSKDLSPPFSYRIGMDTTAIVDVSAAVSVAERITKQNEQQATAIGSLTSHIDASIDMLRQSSQFASNIRCPGGASGVVPGGVQQAVNLTNEVVTNLARARGDVNLLPK
jgi:hypothetical protein